MNLILGALATLGCGLALWQWLAARRFPLHVKTADPRFTPAVSILKPLKGCDDATRESLQSWLHQNYDGPVEILFGVADAGDPVCQIVNRLIAENPTVDARLIICETFTGMNAKAAKLAQLEKLAQHELVVICDADVRVPSDFLACFVAPLRDEKTGLVNCFYRLANPVTMAMRWEAIAINADFWSQVLQSQMLKPLDFALGAAILVRRKALAEIGGYAAIADCLADDYQLGNRIAQQGHRIALSPVVVECWDAPMTWAQVWRHQLRWARTIRACQPLPYFFSLLSNASFWALVWLPVAFAATKTFCAPLAALVFLLVRIVQAQALQRRFTPERQLNSPAWLVPVKDLLQAALWVSAFAGNTVEWRGRKMKLRRDGALVEKK
ncbi:MAG: bacteriohopanetetrol glucosamine biosynthesis glycosyltransferase HpnI [Verrucomicrobiae bacterium]|nr:bacteriohopanetetrol glucosamine biosynthesis glycosyltransferase HpnI [Verrucomicrobiae bacterium]